MGVAAVIGAAVLAGPVMASSAAPDLPANYGGRAYASGVFEHLDSRPGVSPTSQPFYASFGDGNSTYAAQTLLAQAAPYNPGATVTGLPGLICTASSGQFCVLPPYPLIATANSQKPKATVSFVPEAGPPGGPATASSMSGTATASQTAGVTTDAEVSGFGEQQGSAASASEIRSLRSQLSLILGHPVGNAASTAILSIGSISAKTTQSFQGSTLVTLAAAKDSDISMLGGIIHIGSITATSSTKSDGSAKPVHVDDAAANDVTVAGQPASIDQSGVTIGGSGSQGGAQVTAANAALKQALAASGMQIHFLGHTSGQAVLLPDNCTNGEADGLQLHVSANLTPVPTAGAVYFDDISLGGACTTASVAPAEATSALPALPPVPANSGGGITASAPASGGGGTAAAAPVTPSSGGALASPATGQTALPLPLVPSAPVTPAATRPSSGLEAELGAHLVANRVSALYLIFGLVSLAVLLGAVPSLKPRLPKGA